MENLIEELTQIDCVAGLEGESFPELLRQKLVPYVDEVYLDNLSNVIGVKRCGNPNAPRLMLEAHYDQIGLIVSGIEDNGFLCFTNVGAVDERILPGMEVYVGNQRIYGVIGHKPPHLSGGDKDKPPKISDMLIDTGVPREILEKSINIGDPITFKSEFTRLLGGQASSAAMDNRAGVAALLMVAERVANTETEFDLYFVFTAQEEIGLAGAYAAANEISPDEAIIVDVTHGQTLDTKELAETFLTGSGAAIFRGPNVDYEKTLKLIEIAKEKSIPYTIEVSGGNSGTTAWAAQTASYGTKTMLISIPLKYMHTTVETLHISDVEAVCNLVFEYITSGGDGYA